MMVKYYRFYSEIPESRKKPSVTRKQFVKIIDDYFKKKGVKTLTKSEKKRLLKKVM